MTESKCTYPCIGCIEGNHCGGFYWAEEYGREVLTVVCYYPPWDEATKEQEQAEYEAMRDNQPDDDDLDNAWMR